MEVSEREAPNEEFIPLANVVNFLEEKETKQPRVENEYIMGDAAGVPSLAVAGEPS